MLKVIHEFLTSHEDSEIIFSYNQERKNVEVTMRVDGSYFCSCESCLWYNTRNSDTDWLARSPYLGKEVGQTYIDEFITEKEETK